MSKDRNILLVGGSGYLGSHLRQFISNRNIFYTSTSGNEGSIQLDLLNKNTFQNIGTRKYEEIFILASTLKGLGTTELKEEYLELDTLGLSSFLQYVGEQKLTEKIIYTSSMTVYGVENSLPVKEDGILKPLSTYGLAKKLGESVVKFYCQTGTIKGVVLRIPGIYGGNRKGGFIYNTALKCLNNDPIPLNTTGLGYWETIHITDLSQSIVDFLSHYKWENGFEQFNLGYGVKTDFLECASFIKDTLNSKSVVTMDSEKGYVDFYLDNSKIKKHSSVKGNYETSLKAYLKTITA